MRVQQGVSAIGIVAIFVILAILIAWLVMYNKRKREKNEKQIIRYNDEQKMLKEDA